MGAAQSDAGSGRAQGQAGWVEAKPQLGHPKREQRLSRGRYYLEAQSRAAALSSRTKEIPATAAAVAAAAAFTPPPDVPKAERRRRRPANPLALETERENFPKDEVFAFASHTELFLDRCAAMGVQASEADLRYQAQNDACIRLVFDSVTRTVRRNPRNWVELFLLFSLRAQEVVALEDHHREVYADLDRLAKFIWESGHLSQFREALHSERLCVPEVVESKAPHFDEVLPDGTRIVFVSPGLEAVREALRSQMNSDYILQPIRDGPESAHDKVIMQNNWKMNRLSKTLFIPWTKIVNEYS
ncbi:Hypothetical Protein FCC1311_040082 [Hondaea fermentalgiana]|uniref:Uncharacterized protein n=1 Tax=Hondaea fermentalgiana TaxID=2315210 RepID=A0A2R5GB11_9STRA|nr:Hypothetical Protein FCC1311_040082 [Hondaea fermentalgiana]|eukprot:GBG27785.1 Hypothetical Protein FCC1311_040082 [Hondaea fermentalgiana]